MLLELPFKIIDLFKADPQDKAIAQGQLQPVLNERFKPCLDLWELLYTWSDHVEANAAGTTLPELQTLLTAVEKFLRQHGAVVSPRCLLALEAFKQALRKSIAGLNSTPSGVDPNWYRGESVKSLHSQVVPHESKQGKTTVIEPGLLFILRDEVGSNVTSISSVLK